jgi:hypothetical protein
LSKAKKAKRKLPDMFTITKKLRHLANPQPESQENLAKVRRQVRTALSRPYHFQPSGELHPWEVDSPDPMIGYFKPFSLVLPINLARESSVVEREFRWVWVLPLGLALALVATLVWQTLSFKPSFQGTISPIPTAEQTKPETPVLTTTPSSPSAPVASEPIPSTPYTGTGGP